MPIKKNVVNYLIKELNRAGYDAKNAEDVENHIYSEIIISIDYKLISSGTPLVTAAEFIEVGIPLYIESSNGNLLRINKNKSSGTLQTIELNDSIEDLKAPPNRGFSANCLIKLHSFLAAATNHASYGTSMWRKPPRKARLKLLLKK